MAQAQSGVCAEANLHGLHLFFNVLEGRDEEVRQVLAQCDRLQQELNDRFSESMVSSFVAIGALYWPHIYPEFIPEQLKSFPNLDSSEHIIHSQPFDLMYVIRSDREDVNHLFAQSVLHMLAPNVELVANVRGFRFLDGRDFNGFVYAGDTPHGRFKRQVAMVNKPNELDDQGSYVHFQRVKFNIHSWQKLTLDEQVGIMGRTRLENERIENNNDSHAAFIELKGDDNYPLLLNQSMPFGDVFEQGSLWLSCSSRGDAFERVLRSQIGTSQCYDRWLDFTQADMGASFFAPSIQFLSSMALMCERD